MKRKTIQFNGIEFELIPRRTKMYNHIYEDVYPRKYWLGQCYPSGYSDNKAQEWQKWQKM